MKTIKGRNFLLELGVGEARSSDNGYGLIELTREIEGVDEAPSGRLSRHLHGEISGSSVTQ